MGAQAPTLSLTPYIIDYARLQISLEKERKTQRQSRRRGGREREKGRVGHVETKGMRQEEKEKESLDNPVISVL